jgi:CBS domain containing-hemolysin-like protein
MMIIAGLIALVSLLLAAWLRAAGTAVSLVPRADALRDASEGVPGAAPIAELLDEREAISPAVGIVASGFLLLSAVIGVAALLEGRPAGAPLLVALAVAVVTFIVGDIVPRRLGRTRPRLVSYRSARLIRLALRLGGWATDLIHEPEEPDVEEGAETGRPTDDEQERELIDSVLEFSETIVREVMTPRPDMVTVPLGATLDELVTTATTEGFSRVPITDNGDVVGMVMVKDLLPVLSQGGRPTIAEVMRPVEFIPDNKLASTLLAEMQDGRTHQMIVVDEYGDVAGLVTIEDLLEELVGEIADETDEEEVFITARGEGRWAVDARLPAEDLAEMAGVELPEGDWDTVGGLVLAIAERVPEEGERFTYGPLSFTVTRMQGRRVSEVGVAVNHVSGAG